MEFPKLRKLLLLSLFQIFDGLTKSQLEIGKIGLKLVLDILKLNTLVTHIDKILSGSPLGTFILEPFIYALGGTLVKMKFKLAVV